MNTHEPDYYDPGPAVRKAVYIARELGLSTLVVLFLLGQNAGWIPSPLAEQHAKIQNAANTNTVLINDSKTILRTNREMMRVMVRLTRVMCVNTAKNIEERRLCLYDNLSIGKLGDKK